MAAKGPIRGRFTALLLALVALMLTTPLVEKFAGIEWVALDLLFTALMLALLYAMSRERHFLLMAVFLALPAVGSRWGVRASGNDLFVVASFVVQIAFLGVSMVVVLLESFARSGSRWTRSSEASASTC
ncbi:MAG: hypothetical protein JRH10_15080 [Deltaproteobacteria bacterium]|nr:hypothetical protein [Deltaproteobacteria bacterium]